MIETSDSTTTWAYASLLAGGILIVVGALAGALMMGTVGGMLGFGMMGNYGSFMTNNGFVGAAWWVGLIGLVTGAIVLYAAFRLRQEPNDRTTVGTLAIVGGVLSLLALGGWVLGAALAILGGALALGGPRSQPATPPTH